MDVSQGQLIISTVTIADGQKLGTTIATGGLSLCGIRMPAAITGANFTFYACSDVTGANPQQIYNSSNAALSYAVAEGLYQVLSPSDFQGVEFLQIRSDQNEEATRTLLCSMKGI